MTNEAIGAIILSPREVATGDPAGAALENLNTAVLGDGSLCYVSSGPGKGQWQLDKSSTDAPNGTTVVAPIAGPGRWYIKLLPGIPADSAIQVNTYDALRAITPSDGTPATTYGRDAAGDVAGQGEWIGLGPAAPGTYTDNDGTLLVPTGTGSDGSRAWLRRNVVEYDVRWFGAVGDGSTDCTGAINAAIAACPENEIVFIPTGTWHNDSALDPITKGLTIRGESFRGTIVEMAAASNGFHFTPNASDKLIKIEDMEIRFGARGILVDGSEGAGSTSRGSHIQRVFTRGQTIAGIELDELSWYGADFRDLHCAQAPNGVRVTGTGTSLNAASFSNCRFASCTGFGFWMDTGTASAFDTAVTFHDCIIEGNQSGGIYIKKAQVELNAHFEGNGQSDGEADVVIDTNGPGTAAYVNIGSSCHFANGSPAQSGVRVRFANTGIQFTSAPGAYWPGSAVIDGGNHLLASQIDFYGNLTPTVINYGDRIGKFAAQNFRIRALKILTGVETANDLRNLTTDSNVRAITLGNLSPNDGMGRTYYFKTGDPPGTHVHNGSTVLVASGGDGSQAWLASKRPLTRTTTTYQIVLEDMQADPLVLNNASPIAVEVPDDSTTNFPIDVKIPVYQSGVGQVTFSGESSATIESADGLLSLRTRGSAGTLWKRGTNDWVLIGDLA